MFGSNPRLSELLAKNAKSGGFGGAIFSNDPNIGIRMMGKEAFIPTPLNSLDYHPERTAAVNRERKKWYMNTPSFTPSRVLQGAKQGYPESPTREDVDDTRPVPQKKPDSQPPKPVVDPPKAKEPKPVTNPAGDAKDPMFESWAKEIPSLYQMFSNDEIIKHMNETRRDFGESDTWYKTAKKYGEAELNRRNPPKTPELLARQQDNRAQKPGIPETIERPSDFVGPTGKSVPSDYSQARNVSEQDYEMLSKHGPAWELLSSEERSLLMDRLRREAEAEQARRMNEDIAGQKRREAEKMLRNFMRTQMGIPFAGEGDDYEPIRDQSLAGSVANSELDTNQEVRNFLRSLNSPIENFSEFYPNVPKTLRGIYGGLGDAGRALTGLPSSLNESLARARDRGF